MNGFSWPNFFVGIVGISLGAWITPNAYYINHHILFIGWAERKWGPGSGTIFYKFAGIALIIFSILVTIGTIDLTGSSGFTSTKGTSQSQNQQVDTTGGSRIAP
jgi:hypothetical protein